MSGQQEGQSAQTAELPEPLERYLALGWHLLPVQPRTKVPMAGLGLKHATNDPDTISRWATRWPGCSWGAACAESGFIALDVDPRNGGDESYSTLVNTVTLPRAPTQQTGGGGRHYLFAAPTIRVKGKLDAGLDVKHRGYILVEPSTHPSGGSYRWTWAPWDIALPTLPQSLLERLRVPERDIHDQPEQQYGYGTTRYGQSALDGEAGKVLQACEGDRNNVLNAAAYAVGQLVAGGEIDLQDATSALTRAGLAAGLGAKEVEATLTSGLEAGQKDPRRAPDDGRRDGSDADDPRDDTRNTGSTDDEGKGSDEPQLLELVDWRDIKPEPTRWHLRGLLPESVCMLLTAEMKTGKTWLTLDMALALAIGGRACGYYAAEEPRPSLIYSPEGSIKNLARRLHGLCWGNRINPEETAGRIHIIGGRISLDEPRHVDALRATIDAVEPGLIVLDPLVALYRGRDENSSSDLHPILDDIRSLLECYGGVSCLVVHHSSKGWKDQSAFHVGRGSSAIGAWADGQIWVRRDGDESDSVRRMDIHHRDDDSGEPLGWKLLIGGPERYPAVPPAPQGLVGAQIEACDPPEMRRGAHNAEQKQNRKEDIYRLVSEKPGITKAEIYAASPVSDRTTRDYLNELADEGRVGFQGKHAFAT